MNFFRVERENICLELGEKIIPVKGYESIYSITSYGRVWSYQRSRKTGGGGYRLVGNHFLKLGLDIYGYPHVVLCYYNIRRCFKVHRLVAKHYISNPLNLLEINHRDGNKLNNRIENLEWCTHQDNKNHAYSFGLYKKEGSKFYGVCFRKGSQYRNKPWHARTSFNKKRVFIGHYKTELEAAKAYNSYVIKNNLNRLLNEI